MLPCHIWQAPLISMTDNNNVALPKASTINERIQHGQKYIPFRAMHYFLSLTEPDL